MHEAQHAANSGLEYLTFRLGDEELAVEILKVQEIKGLSPVTYIPNAPSYVRGVMNLRGTVVPIVGLRERFGMPAADSEKFAVVVLVNVGGRVVGLVVDAVSDVLRLSQSDLEPPPELGVPMAASYVSGIAKVQERLVLVLAIESLIGDAIRVNAAEKN